MIKLKNILNELSPVGNMNAHGASKVLGKGGKVLGNVGQQVSNLPYLYDRDSNLFGGNSFS